MVWARGLSGLMTGVGLVIGVKLVILLLVFGCRKISTSIISSTVSECTAAARRRSGVTSSRNALSAVSFARSLLAKRRRMLTGLVPSSLHVHETRRLRRGFLGVLVNHFSLQRRVLTASHTGVFPSGPVRYISPTYRCFIFALEHVLVWLVIVGLIISPSPTPYEISKLM